MKRLLTLNILIMSLIFLNGCNNYVQADIYTSIYPIEFIVNNIVEEDFVVRSAYPRGKEVHSYEIKTQDMISMANSKIIFYIGLGMEWIIEDSVDSTFSEVATVAVSKDIDLIEVNSEDVHHHHHEEEEGDHNAVFYDVHIWLDPNRMKIITNNILEALLEHLELSADQIERYTKNAEELQLRFTELNGKFRELISADNIANKTIIVDHDAYAYWEQAYGINRIRLRNDNESSDVSIGDMQKKIEQAQILGIQYICITKNEMESSIINQYLNSLGLSQENKLTLHNLSTITTEEEKAGWDYFSIMEQNIEVLKKAFPKKK